MKFKLFLTMLFAAIFASTASAAIVVTLIPNVTVNGTATQAAFNSYNQNANVTEGTWVHSQFNLSIKANSGVPEPITKLTFLGLTITSSVSGTANTYDANGLTFNTEGDAAPAIFRAYDAMGNDVTSSVIGQPVLNNDFTAENIYEIRVTGADVPGLPASSVNSINAAGDVLTGTFTATVESGPDTAQASAAATTTVVAAVPEPTAGALAFATLGFMTMFRRRK